jgi:hypothetical protein
MPTVGRVEEVRMEDGQQTAGQERGSLARAGRGRISAFSAKALVQKVRRSPGQRAMRPARLERDGSHQEATHPNSFECAPMYAQSVP